MSSSVGTVDMMEGMLIRESKANKFETIYVIPGRHAIKVGK